MSRLSVSLDPGVGAFAVSPNGRDVALASKSGLFVLDLQEPFSPPRWLPMRTIWEVADVQWCYHPAHPTWVISTSNQKAIIWNLALPSENAIEHVLHGHRRAITDINFSMLRPDLVATCSVDTYVSVWDTRDPLRPAISFADFKAGASQVRWNKIQPHILASAHDNRLLIWDDRKNNKPVHELTAHYGKLNTIDWENTSANRILTGSTDRRVKLWDLDDTTEPVFKIKTKFPVWRAQHMPLGPGGIVVPLRGGGNNAYLVNFTEPLEESPVQEMENLVVETFSGHSEQIKEVALRRHENGFDLVTLSRDASLKLWPIGPAALEETGYPLAKMPALPETDVTYHQEPHSSAQRARRGFFKPLIYKEETRNDQLNWIAGVKLTTPSTNTTTTTGNNPAHRFTSAGDGDELAETVVTPVNLSKEVTAISAQFPKVRFEHIDLSTGHCVLTLRGPWAPEDELCILRVNIHFPAEYPLAPLQVQVEEDAHISPERFAEMEAQLKTSTDALADHGRNALEYTLRYLMGDRVSLDEILVQPDEAIVPELEDVMDDLTSTDDEYGLGADDDSEAGASDVEDAAEMSRPNVDAVKPKLDSTPLPKRCGAVWTTSGQLLCFFNRGKSRSNNQAPLPLEKVFAKENSDNEDMYESDSEDFEEDGRNNWSVTAAKLTMQNRARDVAADAHSESMVSHTSALHSAVNTVQIFDFTNLIPSRLDIAKEYMMDIGANPADMANHNAAVATKYGRDTDAYFWRILRQLLIGDIPFDPAKIAPLMLPLPLTAPIYEWAGHPLGAPGMGEDLFRRVYQDQNIQLLACMSILLVEVSFGPYRSTATIPPLAHRIGRKTKDVTETKILLSLDDSTGPAGTLIEPVPATALSSGSKTPVEDPPINMPFQSLQRQSQADPRVDWRDGWRDTPLSVQGSGGSSSHTPTPLELMPQSLSSDHDPSSLGFFDIPVKHRRSMPLPFKRPSFTEETPEEVLIAGPYAIVTIEEKTGFNHESLNDHPATDNYVFHGSNWQKQFVYFRLLYAKLLETWGLHIQRLEVLNHNYYGLKEQGMLSAEIGDEFRADVEILPLQPSAARDPLTYTSRQCHYCNEPVLTQCTQCVVCNHIMHRTCSEEWWATDSVCVSGCGCSCLEYI